MCIWGYPTEARVYNPHKEKLDSKTISGFFIGSPERSKGYRFYYPNHNARIVKIENTKFIKNGKVSGSDNAKEVVIIEIQASMPIPLPRISNDIVPPNVIGPTNVVEPIVIDYTPPHDVTEPIVDATTETEVALRRSTRPRRQAISDDYVLYLQECEFWRKIRLRIHKP